MSAAEKYDVPALGSGTGGKLIAWEMAGAGKRTASIERKQVGGACPNVACLPSKNISYTAEVASDEIRNQHSFEEILGNSPELLRLLERVELAAPTDANVLIIGETGAGKELIARAIHSRSVRKDSPDPNTLAGHARSVLAVEHAGRCEECL